MTREPISVTQLNQYLKNTIDSLVLLKNIVVVGEISDYNIVRGIAYFTLKDDGGVINCVLFGAESFFRAKPGDKVLVTGSPNYYMKGGRLNFQATNIEEHGLGQLYKQFLELKARLEREGLFSLEAKKILPKMPRRIGVVSSKTGAVIEDIIKVVMRRNPTVDIVLYPVRVQGEGAEIEIAKAIDFLDNYNVDVIIVARGGGSIEDLQPFNTEEVAYATFRCQKPIVSAVGHETDTTIIDMVADVRASTPSVAAELVVADFVAQVEYLNTLATRLGYAQTQKIYLQESFLGSITQNLQHKIETLFKSGENKMEVLSNSLSRLNPIVILKQGYARIEKDKKPIYSVGQLDVNKEFTAILKDGKIKAIVKEIKEGI